MKVLAMVCCVILVIAGFIVSLNGDERAGFILTALGCLSFLIITSDEAKIKSYED